MAQPVAAQAPAGMPGYVGVNLGPDGMPYYKVVDDYVAAVAGVLNRYVVSKSQPHVTVSNASVDFDAFEILLASPDAADQGFDNAATHIDAARQGRGVVLTGDVIPTTEGGTGDGYVGVLLTSNITLVRETQGAYVLIAPEAGWKVPARQARFDLVPWVERIAKGWRWGALIGGAAAITTLTVVALRRR